jgi:hypothetical protein
VRTRGKLFYPATTLFTNLSNCCQILQQKTEFFLNKALYLTVFYIYFSVNPPFECQIYSSTRKQFEALLLSNALARFSQRNRHNPELLVTKSHAACD